MIQNGKGFFVDLYNKSKNVVNSLREGKYISRYLNKASIVASPFNPAVSGFLSTAGGIAD